MAAKQTKQTAATPINVADLAADGRNPRRISDEAAAGLGESLKRFGDLSGITYNVRTGELVTGHQRVAQIRAQYGDLEIEVIDQAASVGAIRVDEEHFFPVRVVDWSAARQRAANVAANNAKIQGEFTNGLGDYLLEIQAELDEELPGLLDAVLLTDLLAAGLDTSDASEEDAAQEAAISESYQVIVQCTDEAHQQQIYDQLTGEGLSCKVLTL